jgi:hypothetical protein
MDDAFIAEQASYPFLEKGIFRGRAATRRNLQMDVKGEARNGEFG